MLIFAVNKLQKEKKSSLLSAHVPYGLPWNLIPPVAAWNSNKIEENLAALPKYSSLHTFMKFDEKLFYSPLLYMTYPKRARD